MTGFRTVKARNAEGIEVVRIVFDEEPPKDARLEAARTRASLKTLVAGRSKRAVALRARIAKIGTLLRFTDWHWQIRGDGVIVDFWTSQKMTFKFCVNGGGTLTYRHTEEGLAAMVAAVEDMKETP